METVTWSEAIQLPLCDYCQRGSTCQCDAKDAEECDFCDEGCQCGYEEGQYGMCECECGCENEEDEGHCEDCCSCEYPSAADFPDMCYCECECSKCECHCECPRLVVDANSYNEWVQETCYVCPPECLTDEQLTADLMEQRCLTEIGPYQFFIRTIPESRIVKKPLFSPFGMPAFLARPEEMIEYKEISWIPVVQNGWRGHLRFDGPVHMPILAKPDHYDGRLRVWMSLSPMEVMSQMNGLNLAEGNVLIGGLGMGWLTQRVLQKPGVTLVTQIELDPDILKFFGEPLKEEYGSRISLIQADVWDYLFPEQDVYDILNPRFRQFDTILLDIWPGYTDARRDPNFKKLKELHPRIWAWGEEKFKNKKT